MQQTRIEQGTPYFEKILAAFPNVEALANAQEDQLLALWTGLGYYSRARNLQKGARYILKEYNGKLPETAVELKKIPGIGTYTAAAIASICFGEKKGVVDGNVYRALSRYFGIDTAINSTVGVKEFQLLADAIIANTDNPANYNQGIMEFGALHCSPKKPKCIDCPLASTCEAFNNNTVNVLPVKIKKTKRTEEYIHYGVIQRGEKWGLYKRPSKGIWAGLYEFPRLDGAPKNGMLIQEPIVHKLSHKDLHCYFWDIKEETVDEAITFYSKRELKELGTPIIIANLVNNKL
jgi:A/G-specific adenine glycosylase